MPYAMPNGSLIEATLRYRVNGQMCMGVFHYILGTGSSTDGDAALVLMALQINSDAGLLGKLADVQAQNVSYPPIRMQMIYPTRYRPIEVNAYKSSGDITEDCNQQQSAIAFTKRSAIASRNGLGTFHMGGVPDTFISGGYTSAAFTVGLGALATAIRTNVAVSGGLTFLPAIFNRANPGNSLPFSQCSYQETARTMRRRVVGRGI